MQWSSTVGPPYPRLAACWLLVLGQEGLLQCPTVWSAWEHMPYVPRQQHGSREVEVCAAIPIEAAHDPVGPVCDLVKFFCVLACWCHVLTGAGRACSCAVGPHSAQPAAEGTWQGGCRSQDAGAGYHTTQRYRQVGVWAG